MREETHTFRLPEGVFHVQAIRFEERDRQVLAKTYSEWRSLSEDLRSLGGRGVNLPEVLSEGAFALEMNVLRVVKSIPGANSSWDCYNPVSHKRIQVKACSVLPDLTSFGPTSEWDEIYFLDFYREGNWDGTFDIYKIPNELRMLIFQHLHFIYEDNAAKIQRCWQRFKNKQIAISSTQLKSQTRLNY